MKQKYKLIRNDKNQKFTIQEYATIDGDMPSLLCEETYELNDLKDASQKIGALTKILRTCNIYPPGNYMSRIVDAVINMLNEDADQSLELNFDDKEMASKNASTEDDDIDLEDSVDIDALLKDDLEEKKNEKNRKISTE